MQTVDVYYTRDCESYKITLHLGLNANVIQEVNNRLPSGSKLVSIEVTNIK